jgi:hypothetical protein
LTWQALANVELRVRAVCATRDVLLRLLLLLLDALGWFRPAVASGTPVAVA